MENKRDGITVKSLIADALRSSAMPQFRELVMVDGTVIDRHAGLELFGDGFRVVVDGVACFFPYAAIAKIVIG